MKKLPSNEQISASANAIMANFIPKDPNSTAFSFHFTIPPSFNYKALYQLIKGDWVLISCAADFADEK